MKEERVITESYVISRRRALLWLVIIWLMACFVNLGGFEFKGEEGRRALPAVEMLKSGHYLVPYIGGEPYYSKPPMINWLVAGSLKLCGVQDEFAARLPSPVFVLLFALVILFFPGSRPGNNVRFFTGVIFLSSVGLIEKSRLIEIEAVYISITGIAVCWWLAAWISNRPGWQVWLVPALALAGGMLTKGPAHLVFFYAVVVGVLTARGRLKELLTLEHGGAMVIYLGLFGLWYHLAQGQVDSAAMEQEMAEELKTRLISFNYHISENLLSLGRTLVGFLPWLIFVPVFWDKTLLAKLSGEHRAAVKGASVGLLVGVVFYLLIPGSMGRYVMPAYPIAAMLMAWILSAQDEFGAVEQGWARLIRGCGWAVWGAAATAAIVVAGWFGLTEETGWILMSLGVVGGWAGWYFRGEMGRHLLLELILRTGLLVGYFALMFNLVVPLWARDHSHRRPIAAAINQSKAESQATLYIWRPGYLAFLYYLDEPLAYLTRPEELESSVHYLLIKEEDWESMVQEKGELKDRHPQVLLTQVYRDKGNLLVVKLD